MVSKGLLRLISSVNRRRMKLLLGIALLAYAASRTGLSGYGVHGVWGALSVRVSDPGECRSGTPLETVLVK
ncbi:hypothetical protein A6R68_01228 [Neotoma lepida]|uniref:UDP-glucuronate decarboxylase N-terminal domain-containing protein n=1 Tax=Neotoma lepida TaxID=56216 RepID=A0A1A6GX99_NEOLE|nr:hypothetical protein A6R68_01228 [Neotoma lepida]